MIRPSIAILGEYSPAFEPHLCTDRAIAHSNAALGLNIAGEWVPTDDIDSSLFGKFSGIWIAPGSPYKNMAKTLGAIQHARENGVPCFGTCGGFQQMIIEYARNILGFRDAQHAEYDPYASDLFISKLVCSLAGREMPLHLVPDSQVASIYGGTTAVERYYCNFGVHPDRVAVLRSGPLRIVGSDTEGEVRVVELPGHPFFVGTLYVPQARSTPTTPHPLVSVFLQAAVTRNRMMKHPCRTALRSPREKLGGYIILPRLIDKARLHAQGKLPVEYVEYLLKPGLTLDGRFLTFTGLDAEGLRRAILSAKTDEEVLAWVERHARLHSHDEKRRWAEEVDTYRPKPEWAERRRGIYSDLASKMDVTAISILDLIDMDEGRMPIGGR